MEIYEWTIRVRKNQTKQLRQFIEPYLNYSTAIKETTTAHSYAVTLTMTFTEEQDMKDYMARMEDVCYRVSQCVTLHDMLHQKTGRFIVYENEQRPYSDAPNHTEPHWFTRFAKRIEAIGTRLKKRYNQMKQERS